MAVIALSLMVMRVRIAPQGKTSSRINGVRFKLPSLVYPCQLSPFVGVDVLVVPVEI